MSSVDRVCANPSCQNLGKHLCKGCGEELYCSRDCQKAHWAQHKLACKSAVKPESTAFMKSFDELSVKQLQNVIKAKASTMDTKKRTAVLDKLESIVEKPALVKLAREHIHLAEVEVLLSSPSGTAPVVPPPTSSSAGKKRGQKVVEVQHQQPAFGRGGGTPSPAQMRQQASMIRKNPELLRKAQPSFASLTDEQIRQYADQLDQAANDPSMLKEVERMSKLSDEERNILQTIQEGVSGVRTIDADWINKVVKAFKKKPSTFKTLLQGRGAMLGGVSDEQINSFIDMLSGMSLFTLKCIAYAIWYLASLTKPLTAAYKFIDDWTFGSARYIALLVVGVVLYYVSYVLFVVLRFFGVRLWAYVLGPLYYRFFPSAAAPVVSETVKKMAATAGAAAGSAALSEAAAKVFGGDKAAATTAAAPAAQTAASVAAGLDGSGGGADREDQEFEF